MPLTTISIMSNPHSNYYASSSLKLAFKPDLSDEEKVRCVSASLVVVDQSIHDPNSIILKRLGGHNALYLPTRWEKINSANTETLHRLIEDTAQITVTEPHLIGIMEVFDHTTHSTISCGVFHCHKTSHPLTLKSPSLTSELRWTDIRDPTVIHWMAPTTKEALRLYREYQEFQGRYFMTSYDFNGTFEDLHPREGSGHTIWTSNECASVLHHFKRAD